MRISGLLLMALLGCSTATSGGRQRADPEQACTTGTVAVVGTDFARQTVIRSQGGGVVQIEGALSSRIRLLSGALVSVCGVREAAATLRADSYELREVDGMTAYLGVLTESVDGWTLEPGEDRVTIPLADVPSDLIRAGSAHVWVAGTWIENRLRVASFGVLGNWGSDLD